MIALLLCVIAGLGAYILGRRSLAAGCLVVLAAGYFYGILRANLFTPFSHFIFDAGVVGLYASQFMPGTRKIPGTPHHQTLNTWMILLLGWPLLLLFMPFQTLLVSIVGLRGNMFLVPAVLLGSRLRNVDLRRLAFGLAVLNLIALGFGIAETFKGIEPFFPPGPMTITMYNSQDSGGGHRIPSLFQNAHTYAGVMVCTIPFLFGAWIQQIGTKKQKLFLMAGMGAAMFGVLMAQTRTGLITAFLLAGLASMSGKLGAMKRWIWVLGIAGVIVAAMNNDRWQRYKELDTDSVSSRIAGSVNRGFFEILLEYPMGNGLGGGGTSIPYFLESQIRQPVGAENEYARILLEQGVIGLAIWVGFALWFLTNRAAFVKDEWYTGRRMAWYLSAFSLISATLGIGMLSSIPNTFIFLLSLGWAAVRPAPEAQTTVRFVRQTSALGLPRGVRA
jgi:hypothetical protein